MMIKEEANTQNTTVSTKRQDLPDNKDRTLFCINIDQRCTEDILYELFLQAGPIENIIRKEDRNGNLICLIIYKHVESCEYAINIFNGITLFNTSLKVQKSQQPGQQNSQSRRQSTNNYQNRDQSSRMNRSDNLTPTASPVDSRMRPPQQNLNNLMAQQFQAVASNEFGTLSNLQNPYSDQINRSVGSNFDFDNKEDHHQSRRNNGGNRGHNRGYSNDQRDNRNRNHSSNGFNRNNSNNGSWYDQNQFNNNDRQNSRNNRRSYQGDRSKDRSRSPLNNNNSNNNRRNNRF